MVGWLRVEPVHGVRSSGRCLLQVELCVRHATAAGGPGRGAHGCNTVLRVPWQAGRVPQGAPARVPLVRVVTPRWGQVKAQDCSKSWVCVVSIHLPVRGPHLPAPTRPSSERTRVHARQCGTCVEPLPTLPRPLLPPGPGPPPRGPPAEAGPSGYPDGHVVPRGGAVGRGNHAVQVRCCYRTVLRSQACRTPSDRRASAPCDGMRRRPCTTSPHPPTHALA